MYNKLLQLLAAIAVLPEVEQLQDERAMSVHFLGDGEFQVEFTGDMPTNYDARVILNQTPEEAEDKPADTGSGESTEAGDLAQYEHLTARMEEKWQRATPAEQAAMAGISLSPEQADSTGSSKSTEQSSISEESRRFYEQWDEAVNAAKEPRVDYTPEGTRYKTLDGRWVSLEEWHKLYSGTVSSSTSGAMVNYTPEGTRYLTPEGEWISVTEWYWRYGKSPE